MSGLATSHLEQAWPVCWFETIDSTSEEARRQASSGHFGPVWIAAKRQSQGRGRQGRPWTSDTGNLLATALFPYDRPLTECVQLSFVAGLAVLEAVLTLTGAEPDLKLKWPNDVRYRERKLAGILIETGSSGRNARWVAAGFGVNIVTPPVTDQPTSCLLDLRPGLDATAEHFLSVLDATLRGLLYRLQSDGFEGLRLDWIANAEGMDRKVSVTTGDAIVTGVMRGMDPDGALLIEGPEGKIGRVTAGDVRLLS